MTSSLTPYDTGDRLEPHPWPIVHTEPGGSAIDRDHYGYVDLDDEGNTVSRSSASAPTTQPTARRGTC